MLRSLITGVSLRSVIKATMLMLTIALASSARAALTITLDFKDAAKVGDVTTIVAHVRSSDDTPIDRVESRPKAKPQQGHREVGPVELGLNGSYQDAVDPVLFVEVAARIVQVRDECRGSGEPSEDTIWVPLEPLLFL